MKITKKAVAVILAVLMAISMMPFTVFAAPPGSSDIGTGVSGGISIGGGSTVVGGDSYLTFTGTDSFSIKTNNSAKNWNGTLEYSTDANTWTTWNGTSQISSDNNVLYLRGTGNTIITGSNSSKYWVITTQGTVACSGDIRTLLDYDEPDSSSMGNYCFSNLFYNCTSLTAAPELPATILAEHCYSYMFNGCTSLTMAPELPATMLAYACYYNMFNGCTSLTTAPELPSTSLAQFCYANMFNGCTSLTTAPELPATSLAPSCYNSMFQGCTSLTTAPELWATTLTYACYYNMFNGCANLTTAPELPANDLAGRCYYNMFRDCTSLTTPSELWATDLTEGCYYGMFQGCTGIKLSTEQTAEYSAPYSIPKEETAESVGYDALTNMFTGTGGTFTGTPTINTTYYIPGSTPVYTDGFMVGDDHYDTLDEAIAGSASGDTITALSDVDFTIYLAFTRHTFDLSGRTLDLDGHTITGYNHSVVYVGDNFTIKNGNMTCVYDSVNNKKESYAAVIYPQVGNWQTDVVTDKSTGVVLENLVLTGGINCFGSDVTVRGENTNVTGNYYYALWADVLSTLTVEDGTFTSAASSTNGIIGACSDAGKEAYVDISGGDYTVPAGKNLVLQSTMASSQQLVEISGGTYNVVVPAKACAEGFVPVTTPNAQGKYTVDNIDNYEAKVDGKYYATFEEAVAAARTGSAKTVTVVNDVDLTSYPAKGMHRIDITNVTIDLNQHTFTASGRWGVLFEGTNATIKNGTMEAIDNSDATGYQYGVYVWGRDGSDEMPDPAQKASVTLENLTVNYGIHTYNAEVTVKDCDVTGSSKYYAIWADCESTVNVESGNFTTGGAAVLGTAQYQNTLFGHINVEGGNFTVPAGKKLIQTGSSCKTSNTQFEGGTALYTNGSVYTINAENLAPHYVQNMTTGEVYQGEANNETSIEVADTINEKFYLDKDFYEEAYGANVYVGINYNHNSDVNQAPDFDTDVKAMSSLPVEDDMATFDVTQAPAQVTEDVTINIYASQADAQAGINAVDTVTTNTYKYCRTIITTSNDAELVALAESALDYAAAAQTYFNYNTDNMATKDNAGNAFYGDVAGATPEGVFLELPSCVHNATMIVKSNLQFNLLANEEINVEYSNCSAESKGQNGDFYVVNVPGIAPAEMDEMLNIETDKGNIRFEANAMLKVMAGSSDANKATLAKAAYLYGVAANNYFA